MKLTEVCSLSTGLFIKDAKGNDIAYLQLRHFNEEGTLNEELLKPELETDERLERRQLKSGDVVIASKGNVFPAYCIQKLSYPTVASTAFIVLSEVKVDRALPEFLTLFLNLPTTQNIFHTQAKGTMLKTISIETLKEIEVPEVGIEKQELLVKLDALTKKEKLLKTRIDALHQILRNRIIFQSINNQK